MKDIYHVMLGKRRTTVCVDTILSVLLSLHLGLIPGTEETHSAIRIWMQKRIDKVNDPGRIRVSQWLQREIIEELIPKELAEKYGDWLLNDG